MKNILKLCATLGPLGYLPAPGTMGSLAALPCAYALTFVSVSAQCMIIVLACIVSLWIIHQAASCFHRSDPSEIILDEVVGCLITFCGIAYTAPSWLLGFMLFRLFDICKPAGIRYVEKLPGAYGILLDDCCAGLFANLLLRYFML